MATNHFAVKQYVRPGMERAFDTFPLSTRIFENLLTAVMIRIEDASAIKRKLFSYCMDHAKAYGLKILDGEQVPLGARLIYALSNICVQALLTNALGLS